MSSISQFKDTFRGGVRPNQFYVRFYNLPESIGGLSTAGADTAVICKAAQIPSSTIGNVDVAYRGRQLKVPGDRTFDDWTVTCYADSDWAARSTFEGWMDQIQNHTLPIRGTTFPNEVYGQAEVIQLGRDGNPLAIYHMLDIYPTNVAAIDLDWGTNDSVEEFQITFAINNWRTDRAIGAAVVGEGNVSITGNIGIRTRLAAVNIGF